MNKKIILALGLGIGFSLLSTLGNAMGSVSDAPLSDAAQEAFIKDLHPFAKSYFRRFIREVEAKTGWKVIITSGYRTFAKQLELKQENANNASPGYSWHNYGFAFDINLEKGGVRIRKASSIQEWNSTGVPQIANEIGFKWGGSFQNYHDPVHFDMRSIIWQKFNLDLDMLRSKAFAQFGTNWDNIQGNKITL